MKPAPFDYVRAVDVDHAISSLVEADGDGKVLAGGQSLIPILAMRLSTPAVLVDLGRIPDLAYVREDGPVLEIGAMTRHRDVEISPLVRQWAPLVPAALAHVGHLTIRHRGTFGGSTAHADPAAEIPAVLLALDAEMVLAGPAGRRTVAAADFFQGFLTTALEADEILVAVRVPRQPAGSVVAVEEFARRNGDFALAAVFTAVSPAADGTLADVRISAAGVGGTAIRGTDAEQILSGNTPTAELVTAAAAAMAAQVEPFDDIHAPAVYRRHLTSVLTRRCLAPLTFSRSA